MKVELSRTEAENDQKYSPFQKTFKYAEILKDEDMLSTIRFIDVIAKEVHYHNIYRTRYQTKAESASSKSVETDRTKWHQARTLHSEAFAAVCKFVYDHIIRKKEVSLMVDLTNLYMYVLEELGGDEYKDSCFTSQKLAEKLNSHYKQDIVMDDGNKKRGSIVFSSAISIEEAVRIAFDSQ